MLQRSQSNNQSFNLQQYKRSHASPPKPLT